jgi:hypothetical protein
MKFKWKKFSEVLPLFDKLIVVQFDEYEYYVGRLRMLDEDSGVTVISESDETLFNMPIEKLNCWAYIDEPPTKIRKNRK